MIVNENLNDLLKPKSDEEILNSVKEDFSDKNIKLVNDTFKLIKKDKDFNIKTLPSYYFDSDIDEYVYGFEFETIEKIKYLPTSGPANASEEWWNTPKNEVGRFTVYNTRYDKMPEIWFLNQGDGKYFEDPYEALVFIDDILLKYVKRLDENKNIYNLLKPKSSKEINDYIQKNLKDAPNFVEFIYEYGINENYEALKQYHRVTKLLKIPPEDIYVINKKNDLYETLWEKLSNDFHEKVGGKMLKKINLAAGPYKYVDVFKNFAFFSNNIGTKASFMSSKDKILKMLTTSTV